MLIYLGAVKDGTFGEVHEEELGHLKKQDGIYCTTCDGLMTVQNTRCDRFMTVDYEL